MRIPVVVNVDILLDGSFSPRGFIWPGNGKMYLIHSATAIGDNRFRCLSHNRSLVLVFDDGKWYIEKNVDLSKVSNTISDFKYNSSIHYMNPVRLATEKFCWDNLSLDYSGGGKVDLCNNNEIRFRLRKYLEDNHVDVQQMSVKQVNDFFRDRRYLVIESFYNKCPSVSASYICAKTGFSFNMVAKRLNYLRLQSQG